MTPHISGTSLSAQARYAAGTREILECFFENRPIREEYLIVQGGKLAAPAPIYSAGNLPRLEEAAKFQWPKLTERMSETDKVFAGSIPEVYDTYLVPLIFDGYSADLAARVARRRRRQFLKRRRDRCRHAHAGASSRQRTRAMSSVT